MRRPAGERGQATVELALCLPLVAALIGVSIEAGLLAADRARLWHAAREAARVASVDPDPAAVERAADEAGLEQVDVFVDPAPAARVQGDPVTVEAAYTPPGHLPLVGALFRRFVLTATVTMRIEQP